MRVLISVLVIVSAGCRPSSHEKALDEQVRTIQLLTMPADSVHISASGPLQQRDTLKAQWIFETRMRPLEYNAWLETQLQPRFHRNHDTSGLAFSAQEEGDWRSLSVEISPRDAGARVRVSYFSIPD